MVTEEQAAEELVGIGAQMKLASQDFMYFLDFVYIFAPPNLLEEQPGGKVPFRKWDHILEMAESFTKEKQTIVLKSRQIGFSWLVSAYAAWMFSFRPGSYIICLSRGEPEAQSLVRKMRFIYISLPEEWELPEFTSDGKTELAIPCEDGLFSRIVAFASTQDAGRGETANLVIQDEAEFHNYAEANFLAVRPTIDAGGQMILGSTANKRNAVSMFKDLYIQAPGNGWKKLFYSWRVRPERTQQWYEDTKNATPSSELDGLTPDQFMQQEYPNSEQEALSPSRASAYFDHDELDYLQQFVQEPLKEVSPKGDNWRGLHNFYVARTPKGRYISGTDVAYGIARDYSVTVVLDMDTRHIVSDLMANDIKPSEWAEESMELLKFYRDPWWAIEQLGPGHACIAMAVQAKYPKLYRQNTATHKNAKKSLLDEPGWVATTKSRHLMWTALQEEMDVGRIIIHSKQGLQQFYSVLRLENGEPDHQVGAHDDYPTAVAIAYGIRDKARAIRYNDDIPGRVVNFSRSF